MQLACSMTLQRCILHGCWGRPMNDLVQLDLAHLPATFDVFTKSLPTAQPPAGRRRGTSPATSASTASPRTSAPLRASWAVSWLLSTAARAGVAAWAVLRVLADLRCLGCGFYSINKVVQLPTSHPADVEQTDIHIAQVLVLLHSLGWGGVSKHGFSHAVGAGSHLKSCREALTQRSCPCLSPFITFLTQTTVAEALAFSAHLRLPTTVDAATRHAFVEEVRRRGWRKAQCLAPAVLG